jgi:hypothetical protein
VRTDTGTTPARATVLQTSVKTRPRDRLSCEDISFQKPVKLAGLRMLPRQDIDNGKIKDYVVAVSDDDQTWQQAAKGKFDGSSEEKEVLFAKPEIARYLKLIALSAYGNAPFVSVAELVAVEAK